MKKLLLITAILALGFTGCSKDDGFNPSKFKYNANLLYGTWTTDSYFDGSKMKTYYSNISLTFNKNGTFSGSGHAYFFLEEKYRLDSDYIHLEYCTMSVGRLSENEMRVYWWLGDRISDMQQATFTKSNNQ